jgi:fermentation-respiration switch protein FrsA (DUF1100 family)
LIAGAEEPQILAVWEDSGYSDLDKLIQEELELKSIPGIFGSGAIFVGKALTRDNLMAYTPRIEVAKLKGRSLAVVHGDHDTRINVHHGYEIADAAQANGVNITRWITDTEHILSIYYYPQGYERRLVSFFSEALR